MGFNIATVVNVRNPGLILGRKRRRCFAIGSLNSAHWVGH
jgi:hypothetical protein